MVDEINQQPIYIKVNDICIELIESSSMPSDIVIAKYHRNKMSELTIKINVKININGCANFPPLPDCID